MSGHNKWSQIREKKGKTDAKKSQLFAKLAKLITVETKKAAGNQSAPGLKSAIEKARAANMPSDNIDRAVKKAVGDTGATMESIVYEAYGPGGAALIIIALTNNRNKAAQEVKHILSEHGSTLAAIGSASWAFQKNAAEYAPTTTVSLSETDLGLLEKLVDDLENCEEVQEVFTNAE